MTKNQKRSSRKVMAGRMKRANTGSQNAIGGGIILSPFRTQRPKTVTARTAARGE